jgi:hypothetical protein
MERILAIVCCLLLAACSTSSIALQPNTAPAGLRYHYSLDNQAGADAPALAALDATLRTALSDAGLLADGDGSAGKVEVTLTHYRMRSGGARAWVGVMAGRDRIASRVRVLDAGGKQVAGFEIESTNATAFGSAEGLMEKHAQELVARLRGD